MITPHPLPPHLPLQQLFFLLGLRNLAGNSLAGKEGHPGKAQVMRVHKHVLDKEVGTAAVLEYRGDQNGKAQINEPHLEADFHTASVPRGEAGHINTLPLTPGGRLASLMKLLCMCLRLIRYD